MKLTIAAPKMLRAIEATAALSPGTGKRPQVEATLITAFEDGRVEVSATDLSDAVWFHVDGAAITAPGRVFLPSENLLRCVKQAGKGDITIEWEGKIGRADIAFGSTAIRLPAEEPQDFPGIQRFDENGSSVAVPVAALAAMLKRVNFAVMSDFKTRVLSGVYLQVRSKTLRFTATDGIRMAMVERDLPEPAIPASVIVAPINPKTLKILVGDDGADGNIAIQMTEGSLRLKGSCGEFIRRAFAGNYTDYDIEKQVVYTTKTRIDRKGLCDLLDTITMLKTTGQSNCDFRWSQQGLDVEQTSALDGNVRSAMRVEWPHQAMTIRLDPVLLCEAAKAADTSEIEIGLGDARQPILIREESDGVLYLYILSPRF